tara:strand:+ start:932 stop:1207 length:276 start_codon:yes stop_codon:yes gene_type:complete
MRLSKEFIKELIKEQLEEMDVVDEAKDPMYFVGQAINALKQIGPRGAGANRMNIETAMGQLQQALAMMPKPDQSSGRDFSADKERFMAREE